MLVETDEVLKFYSALTTALTSEAVRYVQVPEKGDVWSMLVAAGSMLTAADSIGIQRALGAVSDPPLHRRQQLQQRARRAASRRR